MHSGIPGHHQAPRLPFTGRSDNTMHRGHAHPNHPNHHQKVDHVMSLNEIAQRDAAELNMMLNAANNQNVQMILQRQAREEAAPLVQNQSCYPAQESFDSFPQPNNYPLTNRSYGPMQPPHGAIPLANRSYGPMQTRHGAENAYCHPPEQNFQKNYYYQDNDYPGQQGALPYARTSSAPNHHYQENQYPQQHYQKKQFPQEQHPQDRYLQDTLDQTSFNGQHQLQGTLDHTSFNDTMSFPVKKQHSTIQRQAKPLHVPEKERFSSDAEFCDYMPSSNPTTTTAPTPRDSMPQPTALNTAIPVPPTIFSAPGYCDYMPSSKPMTTPTPTPNVSNPQTTSGNAAIPLPPTIVAPPPPEEPDIVISFKPKVNLVKGNTVSQVRLVLTDFEGPDADYIKLDSKPHRAFIGAYWTSKTKELALILGDNVPANTPVSLTIKANAGIRRIVKEDESPMQVKKDPVESFLGSGHIDNHGLTKADGNEALVTPSPDTIATLKQDNASHQQFQETIIDPEAFERLSAAAKAQFLAGRQATIVAPPKEATGQAVIETPKSIPLPATMVTPPPREDNDKAVIEAQKTKPSKDNLYGIDITMKWSEKEKAYVVAEIVRGGATWKNGLINQGDVVTHIDKKPLEGETANAVEDLLLGDKGTPVVLTVRDFLDPCSGHTHARDVQILRLDVNEVTIDFCDEEFCDIPQVEESEEVVSQAEWARRQLAQAPKEVTKMVDMHDISKKVSDQSKAAKEQLQNRSEITKTAYDADAVAQQARWAKDQLDNRADNTKKTEFDSEKVAEQARAAIASLANLPQRETESKFNAQSVAEQAKWAKEQLEHRSEISKTTINADTVSEQAKWAKKRLLAKEQGLDLDEENVVQQADHHNSPATLDMHPITEEPVEGALGDDGLAKVLAQQDPERKSATPVQYDGSDMPSSQSQLVGVDDVPGMKEVLAMPAPAAPASILNQYTLKGPTAGPLNAPAVSKGAEASNDAAESAEDKKRRAMQKRLEFLALAQAKISESYTEQDPNIIIAPSPLEGEACPSPVQQPSLTVEQPTAHLSLVAEAPAEPATGATERAELDAKSVRELREICKTKGIDTSTCSDKRDLVDLIINNPKAAAQGVSPAAPPPPPAPSAAPDAPPAPPAPPSAASSLRSVLSSQGPAAPPPPPAPPAAPAAPPMSPPAPASQRPVQHVQHAQLDVSFDASLNGSVLPPPTKNFVGSLNVEEELEFLESLKLPAKGAPSNPPPPERDTPASTPSRRTSSRKAEI